MVKKFAVIEFVNTENEIPIKLAAVNNAPPQVFDWYVRKFNPFTLENIRLFGYLGYRVRLPLTYDNAVRDKQKTESLTRNTLKSLSDYGVSIVLPPENYPYGFPEIIKIATGKYIYPFFISEAVNRLLLRMNRSIKKAEVVIIADDTNLTEVIIDNIYTELNYLSLIVNDINDPLWEEKSDAVFGNVGLNIGLSSKNREVLRNADIIINTVNGRPLFPHDYKCGAAYFNLSRSSEGFYEVISKRSDIFAVKNLYLRSGGMATNSETFELAFYLACREYRWILANDYHTEYTPIIKQALKEFPAELLKLGILRPYSLQYRNI